MLYYIYVIFSTLSYFQHTLFRTIEKHSDWDDKHLSERYDDYLDETIQCLNKRKLPNYFKKSEKNILEGKDPKVLDDLSVALTERRKELTGINDV